MLRIVSVQFAAPYIPEVSEPYSVLNFVFEYVNNYPVASLILSSLLTLVTALYLNHLFNFNQIGGKKNYLAAYFYCVLIAFFPQLNWIQPALIVNLMMTLAFFRIFELYKAHNVTDNLFLSGLLTGICVLIHLEYALLFLLVIAGIAFFRNLQLQDIAVSLFGFLLPPFLALILSYLIQDRILPLMVSGELQASITKPAFESGRLVIPATIGLLFLIASLEVMSQFWRNSIKNRRILLMLYLYGALCIFITLVGSPVNLTNGALLIAPLSILFALYFSSYTELKKGNRVRVLKKYLHVLLWLAYIGTLLTYNLSYTH